MPIDLQTILGFLANPSAATGTNEASPNGQLQSQLLDRAIAMKAQQNAPNQGPPSPGNAEMLQALDPKSVALLMALAGDKAFTKGR